MGPCGEVAGVTRSYDSGRMIKLLTTNAIMPVSRAMGLDGRHIRLAFPFCDFLARDRRLGRARSGVRLDDNSTGMGGGEWRDRDSRSLPAGGWAGRFAVWSSRQGLTVRLHHSPKGWQPEPR